MMYMLFAVFAAPMQDGASVQAIYVNPDDSREWSSPLLPGTRAEPMTLDPTFKTLRPANSYADVLACAAMSIAIFAATKGREGASCPATPARQEIPQHWERTTK
ncbi:hypothetical protein VI08_13495 [Luteibacter yeojuensis]|uniref:Uncharacterized protein n=1 Tax=Luteibacter yeojuensis TaxID=345309 RepID=A0A0F3KNJ2_9GAMM|nr:hypothetical protein VI08_13495 [Luteibacter yeojuensis]